MHFISLSPSSPAFKPPPPANKTSDTTVTATYPQYEQAKMPDWSDPVEILKDASQSTTFFTDFPS